LGTWIQNKFNISSISLILKLNLFGLLGAIFIEIINFYPQLSNIYSLLISTVILRAGYSSFVSLSFKEM
jgi:hypothetical protein